MDHGGHGGHGGHDMPGPQCSLHMLWNTQIVDTCIVFPGWHISSTTAFVFSCLAVVGLSVFYEYLRVFQKKYDVHLAKALVSQGRGKVRVPGSGRNSPDSEPEESGLLSGRRTLNAAATGTPVPLVARITRAAFYGATIFLSFFLMLVFMTYNAYLITAVVVGAALGHYIFGATINVDSVLSDSNNGKTMACH